MTQKTLSPADLIDLLHGALILGLKQRCPVCDRYADGSGEIDHELECNYAAALEAAKAHQRELKRKADARRAAASAKAARHGTGR